MASIPLNQTFTSATPIASGDPVINTKPNGLVAPLNTLANLYAGLKSSVINSNDSLTANEDSIVYVDASSNDVTITLMSVSLQDAEITIKRIDASATYTVTVQRAGSDTFEDQDSPALSPSGTSITLMPDESVSFFPYNNAWRITNYYFNARILRCDVYLSSASQVLGSGSSGWTKVQFNAETSDPNNNFDSTTNYEYTIPKTGVYSVTGDLAVSPTTQSVLAGVYLDGTRSKVCAGTPTGASSNGLFVNYSANIHATAGQKLTIFARGNSSSVTLSGGSPDFTWLSIKYLV